MIPVDDPISPSAHAAAARVHVWCGVHRDLWEGWSAAWRRASGHPLTIVESAHDAAFAAPIEVAGETVAYVASAGRIAELEPWLRGIGQLVGESLAVEGELDGMTDELVDSYDQLTFLYEIARMLSTTSTLADALTMLLGQARRIIGADGGALVVEQSERPRLVLTDGVVPEEAFVLAAHRTVTATDRPLVANEREAIAASVDMPAPEALHGLVVAPIVTPQGVASAACFGATKLDGFTAGNRKLMQAVAEQSIAIAGQFALQEEQIRRSRVARDLELAAQIQTALLPAPFPGAPHVSLVATMIPASEVGGDFYTHPDERAGESEVLALAVGDVAGKGVAAALITTVCLSAMRAEMRHVATPAQALRAVQGFVADELSRIESFVTCILATYDPARRVLQYANAGHTAILHWSAARRVVETLPVTGLPLGVDIGIEVENASATLQVNDLLLFYSDGVTEATAPDGELYGDDRLREILAAHADHEPAAIRDAILCSVRAFAPVQRDDITLLILKAEA